LSRRFREERAAEVERIEALLRESPTSRATILKLAAAGACHNARAELSRIRSDTLVLAASDDPLLDIASQEALAQRIPGASFDIISPSGHDMSLEQPVATAARVATFVLSS
jgi:pimeloyl-ACP methyl ester carboxylesterase